MKRMPASYGQTAMELAEYAFSRGLTLASQTVGAMEEEAESIFYDKFLCKRLGIDYANISKNERRKIYENLLFGRSLLFGKLPAAKPAGTAPVLSPGLRVKHA